MEAHAIQIKHPLIPFGLSVEELLSYDTVLVAFSGGKDSVAALLHLLELGVPKERIELWHHDVDGREGSDLMDWPVTRDYCAKFAAAFGLPIYFSWKMGGFEGEMLRDGSLTQPTRFETPNGIRQSGGVRGKESTRKVFPQVSPNLAVRWCSAYLKIDVCTAAINNQDRFNGKKTLLVTGERAEESAARAKYKLLERHKSDSRDGKKRRHVDQFRAVHGWSEAEVWAIMEAHSVNPHPCYRLGFSRCSCMPCIFGDSDHFATVEALDPERFNRLVKYEEQFGVTLKRKVGLRVLVDQGERAKPKRGEPYAMGAPDIKAAMGREFAEPIFVPHWQLPSGAFKKHCGPS
jgi:3'-phosphoadenosine 5'-phosphosulfate sulfotransferase (PAPS reductase)/FAD synthetase